MVWLKVVLWVIYRFMFSMVSVMMVLGDRKVLLKSGICVCDSVMNSGVLMVMLFMLIRKYRFCVRNMLVSVMMKGCSWKMWMMIFCSVLKVVLFSRIFMMIILVG